MKLFLKNLIRQTQHSHENRERYPYTNLLSQKALLVMANDPFCNFPRERLRKKEEISGARERIKRRLNTVKRPFRANSNYRTLS